MFVCDAHFHSKISFQNTDQAESVLGISKKVLAEVTVSVKDSDIDEDKPSS